MFTLSSFEKFYTLRHVTCHLSHVTCHLPCIAYFLCYVIKDCVYVEASRGLSIRKYLKQIGREGKTNRQTDNATYRLIQPRGRFSENLIIID